MSTLHRVVNPPDALAATARRLSLGFFHHPNYDAESYLAEHVLGLPRSY